MVLATTNAADECYVVLLYPWSTLSIVATATNAAAECCCIPSHCCGTISTSSTESGGGGMGRMKRCRVQ